MIALRVVKTYFELDGEPQPEKRIREEVEKYLPKQKLAGRAKKQRQDQRPDEIVQESKIL